MAVNTNSGVADINKVNASDMNEIKSVVNTNYTETQNAIDDLTNGSGWQNITLASGVSIGTIGGTPQCIKIGNVVYIRGGYSYTKASGSITLGTIPSGYRPSENVYIFTAVGGTRIARALITPSGEIQSEWIYNLNGGTVFTGNISWHSIATSYYIGA